VAKWKCPEVSILGQAIFSVNPCKPVVNVVEINGFDTMFVNLATSLPTPSAYKISRRPQNKLWLFFEPLLGFYSNTGQNTIGTTPRYINIYCNSNVLEQKRWKKPEKARSTMKMV
jgi:hypothetical protein